MRGGIKMSQERKRILCFILALALIFSVLPAGALMVFADDGPEVIGLGDDGGTTPVQHNITVTLLTPPVDGVTSEELSSDDFTFSEEGVEVSTDYWYTTNNREVPFTDEFQAGTTYFSILSIGTEYLKKDSETGAITHTVVLQMQGVSGYNYRTEYNDFGIGSVIIEFFYVLPYTVNIVPGTNMTKTTDSGQEKQTVYNGSNITEVVYTADDGYYFPEGYKVGPESGITAEWSSNSQIVVFGTPSNSVTLTLTAATEKATADTPTGVGSVACTTAENTDGQITGVDSTMEYKKDGDTTWIAVTGITVTGLANGTYYVRVKATETQKASDAVKVDVEAYTAPPQTTYTVTITPGVNMTKTNESGALSQTVEANSAITSVVFTPVDGYFFAEEDYEDNQEDGISVTRDSDSQLTVYGTPLYTTEITLAAATPLAPTGVAAVACTTAENNDGQITGVDSTMEYQKEGDTTWTAVTGTTVTGLKNGKYYVRVKATETTKASSAADVEVDAYTDPASTNYTVTFDANGHGTAPQAQTVTSGGKASKPEDPTATGWEFDGWYLEAACQNPYNFNSEVVGNFTLYAKWTQQSGGEQSGQASNASDAGKETSHSPGGRGAAGVAGMTMVQQEDNGDAWYVDSSGNWKYLFGDGTLAKGWQLLKWTWNGQSETRWYFFDLNNNYMKTGLTDVTGKQYYMAPGTNQDQNAEVFKIIRTERNETAIDHLAGVALASGNNSTNTGGQGSPASTGFKNLFWLGKDQMNTYSGSIIIELLPEFVNTLEPGDYILFVNFDDADPLPIPFTIAAKAAEKAADTAKNENNGTNDHVVVTGDEQRPLRWLLLLLASAAGMGLCLSLLRGKRFRKC